MNETEIKTNYYSNGQLRYERPFLNGRSHGIMKGWWDNGNIQYIYLRVNGQTQGMVQRWNEDGIRNWISQCKNHNQHGSKIGFKYGK